MSYRCRRWPVVEILSRACAILHVPCTSDQLYSFYDGEIENGFFRYANTQHGQKYINRKIETAAPIYIYYSPLAKSAYQQFNFLFSQPKHMLCAVLLSTQNTSLN